MQSRVFTLNGSDGLTFSVESWLPDAPAKAVLQIAHGMAEHAARYARVAEALTAAGYAVYANDHRGHGKTAGTLDAAGYFSDREGWDTVVRDMRWLTSHVNATHPGLPVFLLGHSMGAMLARDYAARFGGKLAGLVLSGTGGPLGLLGQFGLALSSVEGRLRGRRHPSAVLTKATFGRFNATVPSARTEFDWLSRDEAEVDAYLADPWCGFPCSAGFYTDLIRGAIRINADAVVRQVPRDLPILLISGDADPSGGPGARGVRAVADQYRRLGVRNVTLTLYPGARHELLNEINRDEVTADLLAWLDARLARRASGSPSG